MSPDRFILLVAATAGALMTWPLVLGLRRSPQVAVYLLGLTWAANEVLDLPTTTLLGLELRLFDVASWLIFVAALARLVPDPRRSVCLLAAVLLGVYSVAVVRGLLRGEGAELAFSEHLVALAALLYGLSTVVTGSVRRSLYTALQRIAGVLIALLVMLNLGLIARPDGPRTLSAASALVIGVALLAAVDRWRWSPHVMRLHDWLWVAVLAGSVVVLQHRTVWVAISVGFLILAASSVRMLVVAVVGSVALVGLVVMLDVAGVQGSRSHFQGEGLVGSVQAAAEDAGTWEWRRQRWEATLETNASRGVPAVVVGSGYGTKWVENGIQADRTEGPHSHYVELAVRYGLVGLTAWVWLYLTAVTKLHRMRGTPGDGRMCSNQFLLTVLGVQLVWSVAYSLTSLQPLFLGIAVSASAAVWRPALAYDRARPRVRGGTIIIDPNSPEGGRSQPYESATTSHE